MLSRNSVFLALVAGALAIGGQGLADDADGVIAIDPSLMRPDQPAVRLGDMDSERGRELFVSKGCVVCHSINGVGGQAIRDLGGVTAPSLEAEKMPVTIDPFAFFAKMWAGAKPMIALQEQALGYQIQLRGDEIGDIIAFIHDPEEQAKFTPESFIPPIFWYRERGSGEDG